MKYSTYFFIIIISFCFPQSVFSLESDECVANGGNKLCLKPTVTQWQYGAYDGLTDFGYVRKARCEARQGNWLGIYDGCRDYSELTDAGLSSYTEALFNNLNGTDTCTVTDSGWGQSGNWGIYNPFHEPTYVSGVLLTDYKFLKPSCYPAQVYGSRSRALKCPPGSKGETMDGQLVCVHEVQFTECGVGNPILPLTGRKIQRELDFQSQLMPLVRHYNSAGWLVPYEVVGNIPPSSNNSALFGQLGDNWRTNFDYRLFHLDASTASFAVGFPTGPLLYFSSEFEPILGMYKAGTLRKGTDGYIFEVDGKMLWFSNGGQLTRIREGSGTEFLLTYSGEDGNPTLSAFDDGSPSNSAIPNGLLIEVRTASGLPLFHFSYDQQGRLVVAQNGNEKMHYAYDAASNLVSATHTDGTARRYSYTVKNELALLSSIADQEGKLFARWLYDSYGRAYVSEHSDGKERTEIDFSQMFSVSAPHVTVTNSLGKETSYHYSVTKGVQKIIRLDGHASANCAAASKDYAYYDNGTLKSRTDWQGNVTTYVRDSLGRETSRTEAAGTPEARTITTEYHPTLNKPVTITEPGKRILMTYDAEGRLTATSNQATAAQ